MTAQVSYMEQLLVAKREQRELRKYLVLITAEVRAYLAEVDVLMAKPSSNERGAQMARLAGALEFANDQARHFGLGLDLRTGKRVRK